ncbi:hypothetical protein Tco_0802066 [Tanacetum coccineum]|uniref:Uncharacterized protein n=1 Tax=Tanacetum coccineum TaxID=301880 RepID=A0ABQ4ZXX6_9ASTR
MLSRMLSRRLEVDHECEIAYELLRSGIKMSLALCFIKSLPPLMVIMQIWARSGFDGDRRVLRGVSLQITSGVTVGDENRLEHGTAHKPMIIGASHDFRRIPRLVYHDLYLGKEALVEGENVGFDLTKSYLCPSFIKGHTMESVGLHPFRAQRGGLRARGRRASPTKDGSSIYLAISDDEEGLPDVPKLQDQLDLHDRYYVMHAVIDNDVNRRARELLKVVDQIKGECEVLKERENARDKECEDLKAKCEAAMADFDNNPAINVLHQKIMSLPGEVKEHKASLNRMLLERKKWVSYQESLTALESKVASLEAEKAKLEVTEASLHQEVDVVKRNRVDVVLKVLPYIATELVHSDEMGLLVGKLVSSAVFYRRCDAFKEVAEMKDPFDLSRVKVIGPPTRKNIPRLPPSFVVGIKRLLDDLEVTAAKRMRMEQCIQMVDYSLWKVIENSNAPPITKVVEGVETVIAPTTANEKAQRRLELKRFGGNAATKKTQRNLLKQQYENFTASSSEFLRSLSPEWNRHTIVWRNKPNIDTLSLDDLYNKLKIHEPEVKGTSSSYTNTQNVAFVSSNSTSSTNGAVNTAHDATTASTQVTVVNSTIIDNLSNAVICAFFASQPNSPQLDNEDLQQIHPDDLEEMDRDGFKVADGYANNEGKEILEEDWKEVFYRWAPMNQENRNRETTGRVVPVETTTSNALVSCDGSCYDWSDQAEEGPTNFALMAYTSTSSNSEVSTDSNCSSSCLENVKILKEQNEQLLKDLRTSKLNAIAYKTGLEYVEARLLVYKKNESVYEEDIKVLKRKIHLREVAITELRRKLELAQKQKHEIQLTVENFKNSSKSLSKLIDCQIVEKCKTGLGYNDIPPPYTGNFMPPKPDLSFSGLEEFVDEPIVSEPKVKKPIVETSEPKVSADKPKFVKKNNGPPLIEDWISDSEDEAESKPKNEKKTVEPSFAKIEFVKSKEQVKSLRKTTVKQGDQNRLKIHSSKGNQRNWNYMISQRLGSNFKMVNKACYVCKSFDHLEYDCDNH